MKEQLDQLLAWAKHDLENNLLPWWENYPVDINGSGFHGAVDKDNQPVLDAPRFIVLNARLLWTFSAAFEATKNQKYHKLALRAYSYLTEAFLDEENGGFYTWLNADGSVSSNIKFTYGNAFAIYGLAEFSRVFRSLEAKELAIATARLLDRHMWDTEHGGYFETATADWKYTPDVTMLHPDTRIQKTMNTHLHMVEAYTNLLRVHDGPWLRSRVRELLYTISHKIVNPTNHHFYLFQERDWTPVVRDLTLGHDIEGSWLLWETAEVLGEKEAMEDTRKLAVNMARAALEDGIDKNGGMRTEWHVHEHRFSENFSWWEQCEAIVGFLNAFELTEEEQFLTAAMNSMEFTNMYFIDREKGGWFSWINEDGTPQNERDKADGYTCPYHNVRMCVEIIRRVEYLHDTIADREQFGDTFGKKNKARE